MRSKSILAKNLGKEVSRMIGLYGDEVRNYAFTLVPQVTKDAKKRLAQKSPRLTGAYAKDWYVTTQKNRLEVKSDVHNREHYRLTHLLENGHEIKNQYGYVGKNGKRVKAIPHISVVNDWAVYELYDRLCTAIQYGRVL